MRIAYVFDARLPNRETDAEQALQTVGALTRAGAEVRLFLPRSWFARTTDATALREHYGVLANCEVTHLASAFPTIRLLEKPAHALRAAAHGPLRDFDIVYTRNVPVMLACLLWGHPVVYETYRPWVDEYTFAGPLFRLVARRPNFVGAILHSHFAMERYLDIGLPRERCAVFHNGYEPSAFEPRLSRTRARSMLGLPTRRTTVVYAGRVSEAKGVGLLLDLAERQPETLFLLVGSEGRGPIERRAERLANVLIRPWQPFGTLAPYLYAADVLALPPTLAPLRQARNTVLPMKLFLYLAAGRPILAARAPDTADLLRHDQNAWLVEPDNLDAADTGLETLLARADLRRRLANRARRDAGGLTWQARGERILAFVKQRLNDGRLERLSPDGETATGIRTAAPATSAPTRPTQTSYRSRPSAPRSGFRRGRPAATRKTR